MTKGGSDRTLSPYVSKTTKTKIQQQPKPKPNKETPDGYKGRVGIHEVLEVSSTIKEMILKNSSTDDIEKMAKEEGMMTMLEDGIFLVASGVTSTEEVLRVVSDDGDGLC